MTGRRSRFKFASAPNSWGVLDYPSPSWEQSYQTMLDEMVFAGYTLSLIHIYAMTRTARNRQPCLACVLKGHEIWPFF